MKKGFTLVELLCVIVIIAALALVVFPFVNDYIHDSQQKLYDVQKKDIEAAAEKWATDNLDKLDKHHINDIFLTLEYIKQLGYLEKDVIVNPLTKEDMGGCVKVSYVEDRKAYSYVYTDLDCASESVDLYDDDLEHSYIVYSYDDETFSFTVNENHANKPFVLELLDKKASEIRVLGEDEDGLYDLSNEYVFAGNSVSNYVKYQGKYYRILSIDKNDNSMKLLAVNPSDYGSYTTQESLNFEATTLYDTLRDGVAEYKVKDSWYNGTFTKENMSRDTLRTKIILTSINVPVGLISVYDYTLASYNEACAYDFLSPDCLTNNYLKTMFEGKNVWTMNNSGDAVWYINSDGNVDVTDPSKIYYYYEVIKLPVNVYCTNFDEATGSATQFAYELKA